MSEARTQRSPTVAGPGSGNEHHSDSTQIQFTQPEASYLADQLGGRPIGDGRFQIRCPVHEDRTPSAVVHDTGDGVVVHCYAGCSSHDIIEELRGRGLWPQHRERSTRRRPTPNEIRREAIVHAVAGTAPERMPPFTRDVPHIGEVLVLCGGDTWERRRRVGIGMILPPQHTPSAYRWPVRGRTVRIIDLETPPTRTAGFDHPTTPRWCEDWRLCAICWVADRRAWLRAWARILIHRDGARLVCVVSSADLAEYHQEVRSAA